MNAFGVTWADTSLFPYVVSLAVVVGAILILRMHRVHKKIDRLAAPKWMDTLFLGYSRIRRYIKGLLLLIGMLFLFLALLHPQWGKKEESVVQEGRDLLIALDISRSMLAKDLKPNRLAFAKEKIQKLLSKLDAERVGLILFAGSAIIQCPLTTDTGAFRLFLDDVDASTIASGTTAIDQAIKKALEVFGGMEGKKTKLLAILTDGEDYSTDLSALKKQAQKEGLTIFTIGVGTPQGAPVPIINQQGEQAGHEKDEQGKVVISQLNENVLRSLAQDAGGTYMRITSDESDINRILKSVRRFEKEEFEERKFDRYEEQYPYFLGVTLICLILEWIL